MIEFHGIGKQYGAQEVLKDVSFRINDGERVGIVGPNGAGKSTLFALLVGEISADAGDIVLPRDSRLGYVRQQLDEVPGSVGLLDYTKDALPHLAELERTMHEIEAKLRLPEDPDRKADLRRLGELQTRFEHEGGYILRNRAETALSGLGFATDAFDRPFAAFSGGWQMRAELARILVAQPGTLLLDEPSNYLDLPAVEWLQRYLKGYDGTLVLISHDRYLLNTLTSRTIEIAGARATSYSGNYEFYIRQRELRREQAEAGQKNQERRREQVERFIERFRAKNTKASQVQSRIKMLEKMEEVEVVHAPRSRGRIRLAPPPHCGHEIIRLENAGVSYDGARWVLRGIDLRIARGQKIALAGLNGLGKTTLLRMLAGQIPLNEGGRVLGHKVVVGYQAQDSVEIMDPDHTVFATVRAVAPDASEKEIRTLLGGFGFSGEAIEKKTAVLSGGEKIRLAFARLLIRAPNFLLLDEPTTHLDIDAREALESALQDYEGTLCFVSHDIEFVRHVAGQVIAMTPPGIAQYPGGYDYYREKMALAEASAPPAKEEEALSDRKAAKRERAQKVQETARWRRGLEKIVASAEKSLADLEKEQQALVAQLSSGDKKINYAMVNQRLSQLQTEIEEHLAQWERATLELEHPPTTDPQ